MSAEEKETYMFGREMEKAPQRIEPVLGGTGEVPGRALNPLVQESHWTCPVYAYVSIDGAIPSAELCALALAGPVLELRKRIQICA